MSGQPGIRGRSALIELHGRIGGKELVSIRKGLFCPNFSLLSKFNHRKINQRPAVKFIERLDSAQNRSFPAGHQLDRLTVERKDIIPVRWPTAAP